MSSAERRVLVLNHFAVSRDAPGGTRHAELVANFVRWRAIIVAGNRNLLTRRASQFDSAFRPVWVWPYTGNGPARVLNWLSYGLTSLVAGLRLGPVDLVYASSPHLLAGLSGWLLARVRRVPFVLEIRDLWPDVLVDMGGMRESSPVLRLLRRLEHFLYARAARIVVFTEGVASCLTERGIDRERVVVVPNGADLADFSALATRGELRRRLGFEGFVVVYAGAHGPANGLGLVLDAAAALRQTHPQVCFVLVGDGVAKASLMDQAERRGLSNVRFLEPVPKREMPALLHAADAGLHVLADVALFRYGVSPNKLYDYLAAGLPTLTNTPGEVSDILRTADAGVAVDPTRIADGVRSLQSASDEQRRRWSDNGRSWMAANRSRRALAAKLEAMFDEVVGS